MMMSRTLGATTRAIMAKGTTASRQTPRGARAGLEPDTHIPGYCIHELIARGASAAIYHATGMYDAESIALKIMNLVEPCSEMQLQRFMREYAMLSQLEHRNVVRIHERGFGPDYAFIAMEYCEGGDLKAPIRAGITVRRALECLREIVRGLAAAHASGIVHRDLKPANVLLRTDGSVVIGDFGIGRGRAEPILSSSYYMSPEMIHHGDPDERADLYSAGVILYEMLTGSPPYKATSLERMLDAHCFAPIPTLPPQLAHLQSLLDGLLAKTPSERFQSAADVLDALEGVARHAG